MPSFTNTFGGTVIYPADVSYRAIALTANTTLTWPTELATDTDVVASIMDVTPSVGSLTIRMPDATQASVGQTALFFNVGASSFTVADNSDNTIQTIAAGEAWQIYLTGNSTVNGTWRPIQYGAGTSSASASALAGAGLKAITTTLNQSAPTTLLSADYTLTSVDRARVLVWNGGAGTFTMPSAAAAGNDWFFDARNSGSGGLTVAPTGGELINGQASLVFNPGDSARIITDGSNFYTIGYGQSATFSFDYVSISLTGQPSPYTLSGTNLNRIAYQFSGVLTANMQIIVPNTIQQYWIRNNTTGSYTLTVKTSGGTGVIVVQNGASILYCDGTNVVQAETASLSVPVAIAQGGTGATTAGTALLNLGGTSLGIGLFTAVSANVARAAIGAAGAGANSDITSLTGLTTPLSVGQGGTGQTTYTNGQLLIGNTTGNTLVKSTLTAGTGINITNGAGTITIAGTGPDTFPGAGIAYSTGTAWGTSYTTTGTGTTIALSASPAFTGTPTAPTAAAGTNTTQLATTAYVVGTAFSPALPGQTGNAGKYVTTDGTTASWSFVDLAAGVTGTLPTANGGTGLTAFTSGGAVYATSTSALTTGTLPVGSGGTGATALTLNNVLLGNGTGALQAVAPGATGNLLTSNGTTWASSPAPSNAVQYPQNSQSVDYTLVLGDAGKQIFHPVSDTSIRTYTIPANASVAFPIGTVVLFTVENGGTIVNVSITSDTLVLGNGTTGGCLVTANQTLMCIKVTSTKWMANYLYQNGNASSQSIAVAHVSSPFISAYPWSAAGFGAKLANPTTLPAASGGGNGVAFSPTSNAIAVAYDSTPFINAYTWSGSGFGTKFSDPVTLPTGTGNSVAFSPSGDAIAVAHTVSPFVSAYPWSNSGFGTKFANPATLPAGTGFGVAFSPSSAAIAVGHVSSPFVSAYPWSGSGFGTKFANPATLPAFNCRGVAFSPAGNAIAVADQGSPFVGVYAWSGSGFGTKFSDPATLPTGAGGSVGFSPSGDAVAVAHGTSPFVSVYPWSGSGFGTKFANPATLPPNTCNSVAFSPSGNAIAVAHGGTPFISAYPWSNSGFGTKFANPATLPANTGNSVAFTINS